MCHASVAGYLNYSRLFCNTNSLEFDSSDRRTVASKGYIYTISSYYLATPFDARIHGNPGRGFNNARPIEKLKTTKKKKKKMEHYENFLLG